MDRHLIFYYIGIALVFITHIYMLVKNKELTLHGTAAWVTHAIVNLVAALCIAYYFMNKEGFIRF
jgi:hypothetical protein